MMHFTQRRARLMSAVASLAVAGGLSAPVAAYAQDDNVLPEIIVTAQKVSQNIRDVPFSITAVGGEKLDAMRSGGDDVRLLSSRVPSLTVESSFGRTFPRPYIRGLGNTDFDLNASQPVSFVYDEVVLESPVLKGLPLFDIAQVEVLRGPQGTLFGRNTPAGVLKFDSAKPTDYFTGYAQASYATYGTSNVEGAVSGPLVKDKLSGRLSALYQHRNDWVDNDFTRQKDATGGYDEYALRGQLLYTPTEALTVLGNVHYFHIDGTPQLFRANIIKKGTNDFSEFYRRGHIAQDGQPNSVQKVEGTGANVKLTYDLGGPTLTSITAFEHVKVFSRGDIDGGFGAVYAPPMGPGFIAFSLETADALPFHQQFSEELRLSGDKDKISYQVGAFYFREDVKIDSLGYDTLGGGVLTNKSRQHQETTSWAVFAHGDYRLNEALTFSGGVRYTSDEKNYVQFGILPAAVGASANPKSEQVTFDLNAVYKINPDVNLYGRIARGYRAPSIQGRTLGVLSIADTETLMSYEGGVKAYALDRRLRFDLGAYLWDASDLQVTAVGGQTNTNRLLNAAGAKGYGLEFNADAEPVDRLQLTAGLSYNHTEFDAPDLATAPCGNGCTVLDPAGRLPGTVSIDGNSLPNAPRWIGNWTVRYSIPVGEGELFAYTDWAYRSKINFFLYQSVEYQDDRLLEGGLRVGYSHKGGEWEAAIFGRNITNDQSLQGGLDFNNFTGFVNEPRIWGAELKAKF